jgi:hypothetical protein
MVKWHPIIGIDGNLYFTRYFLVYENSDLADNDGNFKKHLLLEFLDYLGIITQYVKDHGETYEIIMKARDE